MAISQILAKTVIAYAKSGLGAEDSLAKVTNFMDKRGLSNFKPAVARELRHLLQREEEQATVKLYSPFSLDKELISSIKATIATSETAVEEITDPELIGGFRVEHSYRFIDATVTGQLKRLKSHLLQN